jgi:hypothetical protein
MEQAENQLPPIDRKLLSPEQEATLDSWLELFGSAGWRQYRQYMVNDIQRDYAQLPKAEGLQEIGRIQGRLSVYTKSLIDIEDDVKRLYLLLTGQLLGDPDDLGHTDDLVQPGDWNG